MARRRGQSQGRWIEIGHSGPACATAPKGPFIVLDQRPASHAGSCFHALLGSEFMFIQTEATPNPATLKFLPGRPVLESGTLDLREPAEAAKSPLAERLFGIAGVGGVFFGSDFITVTKNGGEWQQLKPMILGAIMEHFMSGAPLLNSTDAAGDSSDEFFD